MIKIGKFNTTSYSNRGNDLYFNAQMLVDGEGVVFCFGNYISYFHVFRDVNSDLNLCTNFF